MTPNKWNHLIIKILCNLAVEKAHKIDFKFNGINSIEDHI